MISDQWKVISGKLLVISEFTFVTDQCLLDGYAVPLATLKKGAVFFCGTILTLARTGRYPASVVFREFGLSSESLIK